jgi:pimeloyl-ACP methyl ester carboxylesterase
MDAALSRKESISRFYNGTQDISLSSCVELVERGLEEHGSGFVFTHDPILHLPGLVHVADGYWELVLSRIECPMLLVLGDKGIVPRNETVEKLMRIPLKLQQVVVPGYHHVHLDAPELVEPHIESFFCNRRTFVSRL